MSKKDASRMIVKAARGRNNMHLMAIRVLIVTLAVLLQTLRNTKNTNSNYDSNICKSAQKRNSHHALRPSNECFLVLTVATTAKAPRRPWVLKWRFPKIGDPNTITLNSRIRIIGTPKQGTPMFGNYQMALLWGRKPQVKFPVEAQELQYYARVHDACLN